MAYKLAVFEILRDFLYKHILCVRAIPTYRVYQLRDMRIITSKVKTAEINR